MKERLCHWLAQVGKSSKKGERHDQGFWESQWTESLEHKEAAQSLPRHQAGSNITALKLNRQDQDRLFSWKIHAAPLPLPIQKAIQTTMFHPVLSYRNCRTDLSGFRPHVPTGLLGTQCPSSGPRAPPDLGAQARPLWCPHICHSSICTFSSPHRRGPLLDLDLWQNGAWGAGGQKASLRTVWVKTGKPFRENQGQVEAGIANVETKTIAAQGGLMSRERCNVICFWR